MFYNNSENRIYRIANFDFLFFSGFLNRNDFFNITNF